MNDAELQAQFEKEMRELTEAGAVLPLQFRPPQAFMLLAVLQLALRHRAMDGATGEFANELARNIESRLCKSPAMAEVARRGWEPQYDAKTEERKQAPAAAVRQTETRPDAAKQSGKRPRK